MLNTKVFHETNGKWLFCLLSAEWRPLIGEIEGGIEWDIE